MNKMFKKLVLSLIVVTFLSMGAAFSADKLNLNTAIKAELMMLPGVGDSTADAIIMYREQNGSFKSVDDLDNVKGIGDKKMKKLTDQVTVSSSN